MQAYHVYSVYNFQKYIQYFTELHYWTFNEKKTQPNKNVLIYNNSNRLLINLLIKYIAFLFVSLGQQSTVKQEWCFLLRKNTDKDDDLELNPSWITWCSRSRT